MNTSWKPHWMRNGFNEGQCQSSLHCRQPLGRHRSRTGRRFSGARQRGFSLIEIIVVVVLIGGIVAFAATRILGGGDRARVNLAQAQVQTLAGKVENYEMDTGRLPERLSDLVVQPAGVSGWLGPYATEAELTDPWNTPFEFRVPGDGRRFDIVSYGADRQPGGESVNADIRIQQ